jgi:hypothetical protein
VSPALRADGYLLESSRETPRVGQTPAIGVSHFGVVLQPRLEAELGLSPRVTLLAALGKYSQTPAVLDTSAVFGTPSLAVETASHASLGEAVELTQTLRLTTLAFLRSMHNLTTRDPSPTPALAQALRDDGEGRSYGVQLVLWQRPWHGWFGWLSHTLSRSERKAAGDDAFRLFAHDQPRALTLVLGKTLDAWSFGTRFRYASGAPRTEVRGALYDVKGNRFAPIFAEPGAIRLPDFWQLDVRVDRNFSLGDEASVSAYLEALNVTNHGNVEEYAYNTDYSERGGIVGLPFFLVVGARLEL